MTLTVFNDITMAADGRGKNTEKSPKIVASVFSLHFLTEFCHNTCFNPNHWWCTISRKADRVGPGHSNPAQHSHKGCKFISCCCGI